MLGKAPLNVGIEFGPIIVFASISDRIDFILATLIFVVLTIISVILSIFERKKVAPFPIVVAIFVVTFGLLTVYLKNPFFIIFKDTIYNGLFAILLGIGLVYNKGLLKPLFSSLFHMSDEGWRILSKRWMYLFLLLAISNEVVRIYLTPQEWVGYKVLTTVLTAIFSLYQFTLSKKYRLEDANAWGMVVR